MGLRRLLRRRFKTYKGEQCPHPWKLLEAADEVDDLQRVNGMVLLVGKV